MNPRGLLLTIGAAALAFALVVGGLLTGAEAFAQTATPPGDETAEVVDARAEAYDDFVAVMASELGVDAAQVDAAIRTALKQGVDDAEAAGELSIEGAAALKAVIDVTEAPLPFGIRGRFVHGHGPLGGAGHGPGDGFRGRVVHVHGRLGDEHPGHPAPDAPVVDELPAEEAPAPDEPTAEGDGAV